MLLNLIFTDNSYKRESKFLSFSKQSESCEVPTRDIRSEPKADQRHNRLLQFAWQLAVISSIQRHAKCSGFGHLNVDFLAEICGYVTSSCSVSLCYCRLGIFPDFGTIAPVGKVEVTDLCARYRKVSRSNIFKSKVFLDHIKISWKMESITFYFLIRSEEPNWTVCTVTLVRSLIDIDYCF